MNGNLKVFVNSFSDLFLKELVSLWLAHFHSLVILVRILLHIIVHESFLILRLISVCISLQNSLDRFLSLLEQVLVL